MPLPGDIRSRLSLPVIAAPMFLVSGPELVIAACRSGVIGAFPSLNARPIEQLDAWLNEIKQALSNSGPAERSAPYAVNLIVHKSNTRAKEDLAVVAEHKAPIAITSVGHPGDVVDVVHGYGGLVFHDVIHLYHARKAIEAGVDGIILVTAGAGGHAGTINPFTLVPQLREFFDGTVILAGTISNGRSVRAAEVLGADLAYMGTRFIATEESRADPAFKEMTVGCGPEDIVYTDKVSGIRGNFMRPSLEAAGLAEAGDGSGKAVDMGPKDERKSWKEVWSAGQGVGEIRDVPTVAALVERLKGEYDEAAG